MMCTNCGAELGPAERRTVEYRSLPGTVLVGVDVHRCPTCGDEEIAIPQIEQLNRAIAQDLAEQASRLSGPEICFLRKHLGWSGADFAALFETDAATVSRWESGAQRMDVRAEKLLRVCATRMAPIEDYAQYEAFLRRAATEDAPHGPRAMRWVGQWELQAA